MAPSDGVASGVVALAEPDSTMQTPPSTAGSAASSTHGSTASGTVAPHEDAAIDNAPGPRRAPSNPLLPPDLQLFLERYPQPAFVLRASTIHESIVASKSRHAAAGSGGNGLERSRQRSARPDRATTQQPAGEGEDGMQDRSECEEERLTSRQQYEGVITAEERRERAEDERDLAQLANAPSSDSSATSLPPDLAPASKPFEATPLEGRRPRAHARAARVLQEAFAADEPALAASILAAPGQEPDVLRKSTLLEGGSQKSHDPSRTAEGAVRALYAQRSEVAREKRATDDRVAYEEMERRRGGPAAEEGPVLWAHSGVPGSEVRWRTSPQTPPQSSNGPQSPGISSDPSRETAPAPTAGPSSPSPPDPTAPPSPSTLKELLTPLWHNPMWAEMMAAREDACEPAAPPSAGHTVGEKDTVPLVDVLSTSDAQELLHMLANVVDADPGPTEGASPSRLISDSLAGDSSTVLLELRLPATSAHRHVPGSPSTHEHRRTSSGETDAAPPEVAGDPPSSISDKTAGAEDASTMSAALASSPGPRLPPAGQGPAIRSAALQQETRLLRPFMQVVATLWPESDLVLGTAILTNMPMAVRSESEASGGSKTSLRETDIRASKAHPESDNVGSAGPSATPTVGEAPPCGEASQSGKATQSDERPEPQAVSSSPKNARGSGPENASSRRSPSAEAPLTTPPSTHLSAAAVALPASPSTPLAPSTARQRSDRPALVREVAAEDVPRLSTLPSDLLELLTVEDLPVQDLEEEDEHRATVRRRGLPTLTVSGGTRQPAAPTRLQHHSMPSLLELDEDVNPISSLDVKESDADEQALDRLRQACRTGSTGSLAGSTGSLATTFQPPARQDGGEAEDGADEAECGSPLHGAALSSALTVATEKAPASIASSETTYASRNTMRREQDLVSSPSEERPITNVVPSRIDPSESCSADTFRTFLSSSESGRIILTLDWSSTSLGDISEWSPELRSHVMAILACPFQLALWIGPDGVLLYNDAYARLIGSKHPASMGKSGAEAWAAAAWSDTVEFASMNALGQTTLQHDQCVMLTRDGMLEECYVTWAYASLRDGQGRMIGYQHPSFETTARVIAERRLSTLREISQQTLMVQNIEELAKKALCALATNAYDLPFALLYTCDTVSATPGKRTLGKGATNTSTHSSSGGGLPTSGLSGKGAPSSRRIRLKLQGTIGVPEGHSSAPSKITCALFQGADFDASSGTWSMSSPATNENTASSTTSDATSTSTVWPIVEALHTRKPVFMSDLGKRVEGFASRGWPDPLERGVVVPILEEGTELPGAILIVGLNPRRPFNSPYSVFLSLIARTISTALLSVATYQEQVRKARDLAAMYDARGSFFASVSHELRTPLTLILGPLEDVLVSAKSKLTKNDRVRLETVQRASHRLHNMVNNLLDVSQLESGRLNCKFRPMQIGPRVRELAELFRPAIERCGITFDVQHEEDKWSVGSPFYMADEFLERMLFNLLGNALKYTLSGTIKVTVSFDASSACISIADTGIGIREDDLEAIFERFHRVQSTSRSFEGSGIGLALVLGLVETCGGTITVASTVDEGSTFTIRLPRGSQHLSPDALEAEPFESLSPVPRTAQSLAVIGDAEAWRYEPARSTPTTPSDGSGSFLDLWTPPSSPGCDVDRFQPSMFDLRKESTVCLVVDDNPQMRAWISSELAKSWTVVEAANGKDALDYALGHPVSIIVTDLAMPVMNGRELLDAIRDHPSTQTIPFIFLSAQAGTDARVEALLLGADDFMTKPFQSSELVARVKVHLQLGEVRKELERRVEERTAALAESERKYREISDQYQTLSLMSPVGIFQTDSSGQILFANPRFSEITGCSRAGPYAGWQDSVVSEDASKVHQMWDDAVQGWKADRAVVTSEFRFANGKWVQLELRAYERGYIGSLTDISHQKEVEAFHLDEVEKRAKDAEETRRGTEAFMDMASHELRNPLSGMWQNAEVVLTSLKTFLAWLDRLQADQVCDTALLHEMRRELAENIDGVESIRICAEHQKRIADDIINVSKLNLGLLSIELAPCNLEGVLHDVLKSFDPVARNQHVELSFSRDASLDRLGVEVVVADAGRVRQLAWNFISNALKYAAKSSSKTVSIRLAATDTAPSQSPSSRRIAAPEQSFDPPPGYIWCLVSIEDSGPGLSPEQLARLFARFSQANPSTDQYGGSGLGLYISKKLIELHRGFIEVESALGVGSRFTFAFPAKRVKAEERALDIQVDVAASSSRDQGSAASESPPSDVMTAEGGMPSYFEPAKRARSVQQDSSSAATGPIRVLIVEDNVINQKVMSRQLKQQGFEVTIAGDGQQALDALSADVQKIVDAQAQAASSSFAASAVPFPGFHIVLMDIEMPVMDGLTAIRELRRREREGEIPRHYPVCAVTGNAREAQRKECLEAGFDDIANKPYDLARLLQQISRLIGLPLSSPR